MEALWETIGTGRGPVPIAFEDAFLMSSDVAGTAKGEVLQEGSRGVPLYISTRQDDWLPRLTFCFCGGNQ